MTSTTTRRICRLTGIVSAAFVASAGLGVSTGVAHADNPNPTLQVIMDASSETAPGSTGEINYRLMNLSSSTATDGVLLNIWLPPHVSIPQDERCRNVGENSEGGALISCKVLGGKARIAPGEGATSGNTFSVANDAPAGEQLGHIGVLAVPLSASGAPTEDVNDTDGRNVAWAEVGTS